MELFSRLAPRCAGLYIAVRGSPHLGAAVAGPQRGGRCTSVRFRASQCSGEARARSGVTAVRAALSRAGALPTGSRQPTGLLPPLVPPTGSSRWLLAGGQGGSFCGGDYLLFSLFRSEFSAKTQVWLCMCVRPKGGLLFFFSSFLLSLCYFLSSFLFSSFLLQMRCLLACSRALCAAMAIGARPPTSVAMAMAARAHYAWPRLGAFSALRRGCASARRVQLHARAIARAY